MEEKVKLIKLSSNAWHYKLIKFMFGKMIPEPKKMRNLCPYFWIMIASLLLCPIITPFKLIFRVVGWISDKILSILEERADGIMGDWVKKLSPLQAWDFFYWSDVELADRPKFTQKVSDFSIIQRWAMHNGMDVNDPMFEKKLNDFFAKYKDERAARENERLLFEKEKSRKKYELETQQKLKEKRRQEKMDAVFNKFFTLFHELKKRTKIKDLNQIITLTKRFLGVVFTGIIATGLFFVVHGFIWIVLLIIKYWNWEAILDILKFLGYCCIVALFSVFIVKYSEKLIKLIKKQRNDGKLSWWVFPIYYIGIAIYYIFKTIVWYPIYFIFVSFLWKFIVISIIWGCLKGLGKGFIKFTGIFGEYFGSSYTDYCPGIEWENEENE